MSARPFRFRLRSSDLVVELLNDAGQWETQQLGFSTPGFRIDLISLLL